MKQISKSEENRMLDAINAAVTKCASGADPSQTVADMAIQQNLSTEEAARVCETVNKIASIEYLSNHPEARDAVFPLADRSSVIQMMRDSRKVATDPFKFRKTASEGLPFLTNAEKQATLKNSEPVPGVDPKWQYSATWEKMQAHSAALKMASEEARLERLKLEIAFDDLAKRFDRLSKEASDDIARYAIHFYGADGHRFLNALENVGVEPFERLDKPCVKTGSDLERRVDKFMKDTDNYLALRYASNFFREAVKEAAAGVTMPPPMLRNPAVESDPVVQEIDEQWKRNHPGKDISPEERAKPDWAAAAKELNSPIEELAKRRGLIENEMIKSIDNPVQRAQEEMLKRHADAAYEAAKRRKEMMSTMFDTAGNTSKSVGGFIDDLVGTAVDNTKSALLTGVQAMQQANVIRQALAQPNLKGNEYSDPLSLSATKYLDNLDLHDAFAKAYLSDPYLRQYPPEEVAEAYNLVHEVAPDLITKQSSPHVVAAMLRKYLANSNQIDPLEIRDLTSTEKDRKQIELTDRQIENYKKNKPAAK